MKTDLLYKLIEKLIDSENVNSDSNIPTITPEKTQEIYPIGKKVILRGYDCGILFGTLVSVNSGVYRLKNMRRLWYWKVKSGITLEDVANYGITDDSKITSTVELCDVTDSRVSLLIPCSKEAIKTIESAKDYTP